MTDTTKGFTAMSLKKAISKEIVLMGAEGGPTPLADRMERRAEEWGIVPDGEVAGDVRAARAAHRKAWREAAEMARIYEARK